jgi:hypothetical protein
MCAFVRLIVHPQVWSFPPDHQRTAGARRKPGSFSLVAHAAPVQADGPGT